MVGQIGGLARVRGDEIGKAADLALVWTGGWSKGDKTALGKSIDELKAVLAENQKVYDQAAAALKAVSAGQKANADERASLEADRQAFARESAAIAQRLSDQEAALDAKRRAAEQELTDRELAVAEREKAVSEREQAVRDANAHVNKAAAEAQRITKEAAKAKEAAQSSKAEYDGKIAAIRKIIG